MYGFREWFDQFINCRNNNKINYSRRAAGFFGKIELLEIGKLKRLFFPIQLSSQAECSLMFLIISLICGQKRGKIQDEQLFKEDIWRFNVVRNLFAENSEAPYVDWMNSLAAIRSRLIKIFNRNRYISMFSMFQANERSRVKKTYLFIIFQFSEWFNI